MPVHPPSDLSDTALSAAQQRDELLATLTPSEKFLKAIALSDYVRTLAWAGAQQHSGARGPSAVEDRFLEQSYGKEISRAFHVLRERLSHR
jgi:hypothetical protein